MRSIQFGEKERADLAKSDFSQIRRSRSDLITNAWIDLDRKKRNQWLLIVVGNTRNHLSVCFQAINQSLLWRRSVVVSALASINWARLALGWAGKPCGYVISHLGQLSLSAKVTVTALIGSRILSIDNPERTKPHSCRNEKVLRSPSEKV